MNYIWKFNRVSYKKHFQVITYKVPVTIFSIKLHSESPGVTKCFGRSATMDHGGEANKYRCSFTFFLKEFSPGIFRYRLSVNCTVCLKVAMCACASCVHHALWNTLAVEVRN